MRTQQLRLVATSVLLAAAGVLTVAGSAQRWWPACGLGSFDSGACVQVQDDAYTHTVSPGPWAPVDAAAELYGSALLALAAAVLLLPAVLTGRPVGRPLRLAAVAVAAGIAAHAALTWVGGPPVENVSAPWLWLVGLLSVFGLPCLVLAIAAHAGPAGRRTEIGRFGVACLLIASNPLVTTLFLAPLLLGYVSHDTTPWTEAVSGLFLLAAAVCLWPAAYRGRPARATPQLTAAAPGSPGR